ncbi:hypothetical protein [Streptomyces sp. NPDC008092]|uniref:hypothetical protein n=1 Tax=Streptomyces sp. NPDC008092 TaxID=3364808 RepID=UPI0036E6F333
MRAVPNRSPAAAATVESACASSGTASWRSSSCFHLAGFPTSARSRRRAIRASFDRAARLRPHIWTLVVPRTLSDLERAFIQDPAGGAALPEIQSEDRARLDAYPAAFPDLVEQRSVKPGHARSGLHEAGSVHRPDQ